MKPRPHLIAAFIVASFISFKTFAQSPPSYVPLTGLVGYYPLEGNGNDISGNGNNGTLFGPIGALDRNGLLNGATQFDGSDDYILIPYSPDFDGPQVSISAWVFTTGLPSGYLNTIIKSGNFVDANNERYVLGFNGSGSIFSSSKTATCAAGAGWNNFFTTTTDLINKWHHIVFTYTETNINIYYDGELLTNYLSPGPLVNCTGGDIIIGAEWLEDLYPFQGKIDDLGIWNRELTLSEIQNLNTASTGIYETPEYLPHDGLLGWWPFSGNANDHSGNENHGTNNAALLTTDRNGFVNSAYQFNGINQNITGIINELDSLTSSTITCWLKYTGNAGGQPYDSYFQLGSYGDHSFAYAYNYGNQNLDLYSFCTGGIPSYPSVDLNDEWHFVAIVDDLISSTIYVDGTILVTGTGGFAGDCFQGSNYFAIGGGSDNQWVTGSIDDVGFWNRALTSAEINELFEACDMSVSAIYSEINCNGETSTVTISSEGGVGTLSYKIDTSPWQISNVFTGISGGSHIVKVKDANACIQSTTITIAEPNELVSSAIAPAITCPGGTTTITVTASGGSPDYQYSLNGGTFQTSNIFSSILSGSYNITVQDSNGCLDSTSISVSEPAALFSSISAGGPTTFCSGGSVVLTASHNGTSVQWFKNGLAIAGATSTSYNATSTGTYTCQATSPCGIVLSAGIAVTVNKKPSATISAGGPTTFCAGGSVVLTANAGGGLSYQWYKGASPIAGATSISYTATTSGNYKCRVTKTATGCYKDSNKILVTVSCREESTQTKIHISPNPTPGLVTLSFENEHNSGEIIVSAVDGRILTKNPFENTSQNIQIDLSSYPPGLYNISVVEANGQSTYQVIKID